MRLPTIFCVGIFFGFLSPRGWAEPKRTTWTGAVAELAALVELSGEPSYGAMVGWLRNRFDFEVVIVDADSTSRPVEVDRSRENKKDQNAEIARAFYSEQWKKGGLGVRNRLRYRIDGPNEDFLLNLLASNENTLTEKNPATAVYFLPKERKLNVPVFGERPFFRKPLLVAARNSDKQDLLLGFARFLVNEAMGRVAAPPAEAADFADLEARLVEAFLRTRNAIPWGGVSDYFDLYFYFLNVSLSEIINTDGLTLDAYRLLLDARPAMPLAPTQIQSLMTEMNSAFSRLCATIATVSISKFDRVFPLADHRADLPADVLANAAFFLGRVEESTKKIGDTYIWMGTLFAKFEEEFK